MKILISYWIFIIIFTIFNYISDMDLHPKYITTEPPQFEAVVSGFYLITWTPFIIILLAFLHVFIAKYSSNIYIFRKINKFYIFLLYIIILLIISSIYLTYNINNSSCPHWQYKIIIVGYNISLFVFIILLYIFNP